MGKSNKKRLISSLFKASLCKASLCKASSCKTSLCKTSLCKSSFILIIIAMLVLIPLVLAIPQDLTINGRLTNPNNVPLEGTYTFNFSIYNAPSGNGTPLYSSTQSITTDLNGVYNARLTGINLNFSEQYYLGIKVGNDSEMTPRINLSSAPYTFRAQNISVSGVEFTSNTNLGNYNLTTSGTINASTGFFSWLGSLTNRITGAFIQDANINGTISGAGNINITGNITAGYFIGDGSRLSNLNVSGMNYTNLALTNQSNIYSSGLTQNFSNNNLITTGSLYAQTIELTYTGFDTLYLGPGVGYSYITSDSGIIDFLGNNLIGIGSGVFEGNVTIDVTSAEAFLVRQNNDANDIFTIKTTGTIPASFADSPRVTANAYLNLLSGTIVGPGLLRLSGENDVNDMTFDFDSVANQTSISSSATILNFSALNLATTGNITASYFIGDGRYLTNVAGVNASWNQTLADSLYAKYQFTNNNFNGTGNFTASYFIGSGQYLTGIAGMNYTNLALTNQSNTYSSGLTQNFSNNNLITTGTGTFGFATITSAGLDALYFEPAATKSYIYSSSGNIDFWGMLNLTLGDESASGQTPSFKVYGYPAGRSLDYLEIKAIAGPGPISQSMQINVSSGELYLVNTNVYSGGYGEFDTFRALTKLEVGADMDITAGSITDTSGAISFGNENLVTTGNINASYFIGDGSLLTGIKGMNYTNLALLNQSNNFGANNLTTTGRIGIGTSSPASALNVVGNANVTGESYLGNVNISSSTISTLSNNVTITSAGGSVIIRLG